MQQEQTIIGTGLAEHVTKSATTTKATGVKTRKQTQQRTSQGTSASKTFEEDPEVAAAATAESECKVKEVMAASSDLPVSSQEEAVAANPEAESQAAPAEELKAEEVSAKVQVKTEQAVEVTEEAKCEAGTTQVEAQQDELKPSSSPSSKSKKRTYDQMTASDVEQKTQEVKSSKVSSKRLRLSDGTMVSQPVVVNELSKVRSDVTHSEIAECMDGRVGAEVQCIFPAPAQEVTAPEEPEQVQAVAIDAINPEAEAPSVQEEEKMESVAEQTALTTSDQVAAAEVEQPVSFKADETQAIAGASKPKITEQASLGDEQADATVPQLVQVEAADFAPQVEAEKAPQLDNKVSEPVAENPETSSSMEQPMV